MKHLSIIIVSIILAVIACILPHWVTKSTSESQNSLITMGTTVNYGLFSSCTTRSGKTSLIPLPISLFHTKCTEPVTGTGLLHSQICAIAGPSLLAISMLLGGMGMNKNLILAALAGGVACLTATLIIVDKSYIPSISQNCDSVDTCPVLSISWYLELGATIVAAIVAAIVAFAVAFNASRKK